MQNMKEEINEFLLKMDLTSSGQTCPLGIENYQILFSLHLIHRSQAFQFPTRFSVPLIQLG